MVEALTLGSGSPTVSYRLTDPVDHWCRGVWLKSIQRGRRIGVVQQRGSLSEVGDLEVSYG